MIELSRRQARRIAVRAQGLTSPRPTTLAEAVRTLGAIQVDLTAYLAPSAELVLWSRLGRRFSREDLEQAVTDRTLVEVDGFLRPAEDVALFRAQMDAWPADDDVPGVRVPAQRELNRYRARQARWVEANAAARDEILQTLRSEGPLPARELRTHFAEPYTSSGWNNDKSTIMMLERLSDAGRVAVSHREGRERVWDLADRVYPDVRAVPLAEARRTINERKLAALGLARADGPACSPGIGEIGEECRIEGVRGTWRVDPVQLADDTFRGRTALLSPLDRLVFDRKRMAEIFAFDYALEMYKPAAHRRWGYYALPVLHGDALVGKVDAEADREAGMLRVHAVHRDTAWSATVVDGVETELRSLARMLGLELRREGRH